MCSPPQQVPVEHGSSKLPHVHAKAPGFVWTHRVAASQPHVLLFGSHLVPTASVHTPLWQTPPPQHWLSSVHVPSPQERHATHAPPLHSLPQQSAADVHDCETAAQQTPLAPQAFPMSQHGLRASHPAPIPAHDA